MVYYKEVLGKPVWVLFPVSDGGQNVGQEYYRGVVRKMREETDETMAYQITHFVQFDDGDEEWMDITKLDEEGRISWSNLATLKQEQEAPVETDREAAAVQEENSKPKASPSKKKATPKKKSAERKVKPKAKQVIPGSGRGTRQKGCTFEDRIVQLQDYKEKFGHVDIPTVRRDPYYNLGLWLAAQRSMYRHKSLRKERLEDLRKMGCLGFGEPESELPEDTNREQGDSKLHAKRKRTAILTASTSADGGGNKRPNQESPLVKEEDTENQAINAAASAVGREEEKEEDGDEERCVVKDEDVQDETRDSEANIGEREEKKEDEGGGEGGQQAEPERHTSDDDAGAGQGEEENENEAERMQQFNSLNPSAKNWVEDLGLQHAYGTGNEGLENITNQRADQYTRPSSFEQLFFLTDFLFPGREYHERLFSSVSRPGVSVRQKLRNLKKRNNNNPLVSWHEDRKEWIPPTASVLVGIVKIIRDM